MHHKHTSTLYRLLHNHVLLNQKERNGVLGELRWIFKRARVSILFMCVASILMLWLMPGKYEMYVNVIGLIALLLFLIAWINAERQGNHMPVFSQYSSSLKWILYRHISVLLYFLTLVAIVTLFFAFA